LLATPSGKIFVAPEKRVFQQNRSTVVCDKQKLAVSFGDISRHTTLIGKRFLVARMTPFIYAK
jgi:hypothetical protein